MLLSKRDIKATDASQPFGGGVTPMSGGSGGSGGSGTAHEANPNHQGPPPAAAGASHIIRCNECGYNAKDGGDLDEHMRKEHFVSNTMASKTAAQPKLYFCPKCNTSRTLAPGEEVHKAIPRNPYSADIVKYLSCGHPVNVDTQQSGATWRQFGGSRKAEDIAVPAALIFVDALGDTLPFKQSFTFKELSDFCHREGVNLLSPTSLTEADLIRIAENVATFTSNHVKIAVQPTRGEDRDPISAVDLGVAAKSAEKECRSCQAKIASYRIFCDDCKTAIGQPGSRNDKQAIRLYAHVTLVDGASLHVVEIGKETLIGVDDFFVPREFTAVEATTIHNMDDDLRTVEAARCDMCGEDVYEFSAKCANCGASRES